MPVRPRLAAVVACTLLLLFAPTRAQQLDLPEPRNVAPGVLLYHLDSPTLVEPEGPISIWILRLDPARVDLQAALANDEIMGTETVAGIAGRHKPIAAINAGFFLPNGDPAGVDDDRRPARERYAAATRGGRHLEGRDRRRARVRAPARHGVARPRAQRPPGSRRFRSMESTRRGFAGS